MKFEKKPSNNWFKFHESQQKQDTVYKKECFFKGCIISLKNSWQKIVYFIGYLGTILKAFLHLYVGNDLVLFPSSEVRIDYIVPP